MSAEFALRLALRINHQLARDDVAGVAVTHGTNTMEESCWLADLLLRCDKPAVFSGAQRAHDDPNPDGPGNILGAVRTAAAPDARGLGAVICFADQIHAARDVIKEHERARHVPILRRGCARRGRCRSGGAPPPAGASPDVRRRPARDASAAASAVSGLRCRAGPGRARARRQGLVIEAFGRGNGPGGVGPGGSRGACPWW
jgi:L-asparaginase